MPKPTAKAKTTFQFEVGQAVRVCLPNGDIYTGIVVDRITESRRGAINHTNYRFTMVRVAMYRVKFIWCGCMRERLFDETNVSALK